ncbi:MAG: hypothetical protein R2795_16615 [Saprospiraceae bacterium]
MKNINRTAILVLFKMLLLLVLPEMGKAAHLIGGEVTYECMGYNDATNSNDYVFTFNIYRDCQSGGSQFDNPNFSVQMLVTIYQGSSFYDGYNLGFPVITPIDLEENINNPCINIPDNICVEQGRYTLAVSLPVSTNPITLSINAAVETIPSPTF